MEELHVEGLTSNDQDRQVVELNIGWDEVQEPG